MSYGTDPLELQNIPNEFQNSDSNVATKDLVKSFGWDAYDQFMQYDVQGLNGVLFGKHEDKTKGGVLKGTIGELFEGQPIICIKCMHFDCKSSGKESFNGCCDVYGLSDKYAEVENQDGDGNKYHAENLGSQDLWPIPSEKSKKDNILLFKLCNPKEEEIWLFMKALGKHAEILAKLNEMAEFTPCEEVKLQETRVKFTFYPRLQFCEYFCRGNTSSQRAMFAPMIAGSTVWVVSLGSPAMHQRNLRSVVFNLLAKFLPLPPCSLNKLQKDELVHQPLIKIVAGALPELPWEILVDIFARLEVPDLVRAGSVCSSWNSAYTSIQSFGPYKKQQTPCLLYTSESASVNVAHLYSLAEKRAYRLTLPAPDIHKRYLIGSSHGWLITVDEWSEMHLLNPITAEQIALPSVLTMEHVTAIYDDTGAICKYSYSKHTVQPFARRPLTVAPAKLRRYLHHKALVFLDDASAGNYIVVLIYCPYGQLSFARVGDDKWTRLPSHRHFQDCIYKDGVLYGVTSFGDIIAIDLSGAVPSAEAITDRVCNHVGNHRFYIVEAPWGDLLQVWRKDVWIEEMGDGRQQAAFHNKAGWMKIYKVCDVAKKLVQVESLDGHVLFLGNCLSFCACAKDYPQLKPNHVYFTHDVEGVAIACEVGGGLHIGVLDYGTKSTEEIVWPRPWSNCLSPVFIIPNPRKMGLRVMG